METIASWLSNAVGPLATKVMAALGFGYVTFTGLDAALSTALDAARSSFSGVPLDVMLLVSRFGFFDYMSITAGGVVSGITWLWLKRVVVTAGAAA